MIPRLTEKDSSFQPLLVRAAKLICTSSEFDALANEAGLRGFVEGVTDPSQRDQIRAEIDGIVPRIYGLAEEEFAYILTTFPLISQAAKDAAIAAYREFAPKTIDQQIAALILIAAGESSTVEFKSSVRWDVRESRLNEPLKFSVIKTIAAFLNSSGGTLLIGVEDDRRVVGIQGDYGAFKKADGRDAFENWLTTQLLDQFGKAAAHFFPIHFHEIGGQDICRIVAEPQTS